MILLAGPADAARTLPIVGPSIAPAATGPPPAGSPRSRPICTVAGGRPGPAADSRSAGAVHGSRRLAGLRAAKRRGRDRPRAVHRVHGRSSRQRRRDLARCRNRYPERGTRAARTPARGCRRRDRHYPPHPGELPRALRSHFRHHLCPGGGGRDDRTLRRERLLQRPGARAPARIRRPAPPGHDAEGNRRAARLRRRAGLGARAWRSDSPWAGC